MPSARSTIRTVILSQEAQRTHDDALTAFPRFDEAYQGLEWRIARSPAQGAKGRYSEALGVYVCLVVQEGNWIAETPEIWVLYTFDDQEVLIHNLNVILP